MQLIFCYEMLENCVIKQ